MHTRDTKENTKPQTQRNTLTQNNPREKRTDGGDAKTPSKKTTKGHNQDRKQPPRDTQQPERYNILRRHKMTLHGHKTISE